jgi:hypothetical protein
MDFDEQDWMRRLKLATSAGEMTALAMELPPEDSSPYTRELATTSKTDSTLSTPTAKTRDG